MLSLASVTVRFGGVVALSGVSLSLRQGEVAGLVGPNGAGKTTVFDVISGFVRPAAGRIRFDGRDLTRAPVHRRAAAGIGRTFQIPQPLHELTVRENLRVAQRFGAGAAAARDEAALDEILDLLGLGGKAEAQAALDLTLTEKKALEVAKALATRPRLLLLDEVLAGLTTEAKRELTETIARLHRRYGLAVLVIEHDLETIGSLCPRVVVLDFGSVIADGRPEEVFADPAVIRSYTGE